jgi:hypothetical protein
LFVEEPDEGQSLDSERVEGLSQQISNGDHLWVGSARGKQVPTLPDPQAPLWGRGIRSRTAAKYSNRRTRIRLGQTPPSL